MVNYEKKSPVWECSRKSVRKNLVRIKACKMCFEISSMGDVEESSQLFLVLNEVSQINAGTPFKPSRK